jgi:hypothetical protein
MKVLKFEEITGSMKVLYKRLNEIYATTVIETTLGHPSIPMVRLEGGFTIMYGAYDKLLYADNPTNRTELLLEDETILTDLNTE